MHILNQYFRRQVYFVFHLFTLIFFPMFQLPTAAVNLNSLLLRLYPFAGSAATKRIIHVKAKQRKNCFQCLQILLISSLCKGVFAIQLSVPSYTSHLSVYCISMMSSKKKKRTIASWCWVSGSFPAFIMLYRFAS